ncbi:hypothetical protein BJ138DRAFT_1106521 [Hygrophoropsis aurantiaca]|uniref:Uncharacterized protein n=1 Tax=Hygrophoropsis aurantiaca TaxID=72124 RepID=A0ACB7ZUA2_9AGAM|nr:hypothetical protein BJ138DRAFT_1106521 [Hygrophoropsis aurantiaca]
MDSFPYILDSRLSHVPDSIALNPHYWTCVIGNPGCVEWESGMCGMGMGMGMGIREMWDGIWEMWEGIREVWNVNPGCVEWNLGDVGGNPGGVECESGMCGMGIRDVWNGNWGCMGMGIREMWNEIWEMWEGIREVWNGNPGCVEWESRMCGMCGMGTGDVWEWEYGRCGMGIREMWNGIWEMWEGIQDVCNGNTGGVEWEYGRCGIGTQDMWNGNTGYVEWNLGGVAWESGMRGLGIQDVWNGNTGCVEWNLVSEYSDLGLALNPRPIHCAPGFVTSLTLYRKSQTMFFCILFASFYEQSKIYEALA